MDFKEPNSRYAPYRRLYGTEKWRRLARHQITFQPLCEECLKHNRISPAQVADHVTPHKGDELEFYLGALQSLCFHCHSATKRRVEIRGYSREIGEDGYPIDPKHPWYSQRSRYRSGSGGSGIP